MTVETQLKALFNIPDNVQATPAAMAIEYESLIARLEIKKRYITELYEKYLAEAEAVEASYGGRTISGETGIAELGFSDKCTSALLKKGVNKLGDLKNVSRMELVREKTIGGDNVARLDRIIAPTDISYKIAEEYQNAGEGVVDDSILEENDRKLKNSLDVSDREIEEEVKERVAQEMEDFKASYKDTMCDDCTYRRAAENDDNTAPETAAEKQEEDPTSCSSCEEPVCPETGVCVKDEKTAETAENIHVEEAPNVENEVFEAENCRKSAEMQIKSENITGVASEEPLVNAAVPAENSADEKQDYLSFLDNEDLNPVAPVKAETADNMSEYDYPESGPAAETDNNGISQFLDGLEDETAEPEVDNNPESFEKTNEEKVFSQIADLIDVDGFEPTVEGEDEMPAPRLEGDVDLFELPPVYHINENLAENTFVPPEEDIYTGLEEEVELGDDDFEDD